MKKKLSEVPVHGIVELVLGQRAFVTNREEPTRNTMGWSRLLFYDGTAKPYFWDVEGDREVDYLGDGYYEVVFHLNGEENEEGSHNQ